MDNRQDSSNNNNNNDNKNYKKKKENDNDFININANAAKSFTDLWQQYSPTAWSEMYNEYVKYTVRMTEILVKLFFLDETIVRK